MGLLQKRAVPLGSTRSQPDGPLLKTRSSAACRLLGLTLGGVQPHRRQRRAKPSSALLSPPPTHRLSPMATASSPPLPPPSTVSALPPLCPSRLRFLPTPPPPAASISPLSLRRGCRSWPGLRCRGAAGPLPPSSEPPPPSPQDWQERLSRLQDTVRIFFAVLFWMSLFFWGSAWGGNNSSGGKKRQRFRKKSK